jgi:hypothetical protein
LNKSDINPGNFFPEGKKLFHVLAFYKDKKYYIYSKKKTKLLEKKIISNSIWIMFIIVIVFSSYHRYTGEA